MRNVVPPPPAAAVTTGGGWLRGRRSRPPAPTATPDDVGAGLHRFSRLMAEAGAAGTPVVPAVLQQTAELLGAAYVEILIDEDGAGRTLWSLRVGRRPLGPVAVGRRHLPHPWPLPGPRRVTAASVADRRFLADRDLREALLVPLRVDGATTGHLLVGDRGAPGPADARLLETVANHASASLASARLIERLRFESRHDELTGLPNRLHFRGLLEAAAGASPQTPIAVMVIDLNGFKTVNDTLGHAAGDELLRVLAGRFAAAVGPDGVVARLGGDEFAVLAVDVPDEGAAADLAVRVLGSFDQPVPLAGTRLRFGGSVGVALGPAHGTTGADLLRHADVAMYAAKSTGSVTWRLYADELLDEEDSGATLLTLATDLREALVNGDVQIVVQPLVDLRSGALHSVEALARWQHPVLGEIAPESFFAAAERSGLAPALSEHVLDRALAATREWQEHGLTVRVSVNVAARWLADPALADRISRALARHGVPADRLCLELTELSAMADPQHTQEILGQLRELGVHLAVDDFGTGYTSLTYLARLPVDQIKIDGSFVRQIATSERDRALVRSIVDLGRNLGLEVVAEGVGDAAAHRTLRELGCDVAQGYRFSPPMPPCDLPALVTRLAVIGWPTGRVNLAPAAAPARKMAMGPRGLALPSVSRHPDTLAGWQTTVSGSSS